MQKNIQDSYVLELSKKKNTNNTHFSGRNNIKEQKHKELENHNNNFWNF